MTGLGAALAYAALGIYVFPCNADKEPLTTHGFHDASVDPNRIRAWWIRHPDASVGVATGQTGLVVVDLDVKDGEDGPGNWKLHLNGHRPPPATFTVTTPSGGKHLWYRDPDSRCGTNSNKIAPGVDIRAVGGYVVAPGSPGYTWDAELPLSLDDIPAMPPGIVPETKGPSGGHWKSLDRATLHRLDLATLEALEALGGHGAILSGDYVAVTRPGKQAGTSASIGYSAPGTARVFTGNWPKLEERLYTLDELTSIVDGGPVVDQHDVVELLHPLDVVCAADVELRRVRYTWEGRIPVGAVTVLPGEEGIGKTTVGIRVMADLTCGTLPGEFYGTPRNVLVLAAEDGLGDVFVPRLQQAGADLTRVHIVRARMGVDGVGRDVIVPRDLEVIGAEVRRHEAVLVWIDSLVTTLPDELKSIAYKDTAKALKQIGGWAEAEGVAVAAPWHLNKGHGTDTAIRMMDSRAFRTAVRSVLLIVADPEAPEGTVGGLVALDKANAGTLGVPALRYHLQSSHYVVEEVDTNTGEIRDVAASCGVAVWRGEVAGDGREIARATLAPKIEREDGPDAWLRDYLTREGESLRDDVLTSSEGMFSESALKRAARKIGVHSRDDVTKREGSTPLKRALWSLPGRSVHPSTDRPDRPTGEGYIHPMDPIGAGQRRSGRSGRSGVCGPTEANGECKRPDHPCPLHSKGAAEAQAPPDPPLCTGCGSPLNPVLGAAGETTHPTCDPSPATSPEPEHDLARAVQVVTDLFGNAVEVGVCGRCHQPDSTLVGVDSRGRPACADCAERVTP